MLDPKLVEELNRGYVCPSDAGPAWRAAYEAGCDMAAIEENLRLSYDERVEKHQRRLNWWLEFEEFCQKLERSQRFIPKHHNVHPR